MVDSLNLLLLAVLVGLTGVLLVLNFLPRGAPWSLPLGFAAAVLGVVATGWLGMILAEFGWFGHWQLLAVLTMLSGGLFIRYRASTRTDKTAEQVPDEDHWATWEWILLGAWLAAALWLFLRPHEYIFGGADAGVYISLGAEIAQNGSFQVVDETFAALPAELQTAVTRALPNTPGAASYLFPGFYVTDAAAGRLTPQFYPIHPLLQAVIFGASGGGAPGIRSELLLTGFWMLLGTLSVYLAARDVGGPAVAALVLAGLSVSALQVWFGRYPTSEALTQFLLWSGVWSAGRWLDDRNPPNLWAFVAGGAFGAVFLVRIDSLVMLPVFALVLIWRWAGGWRRSDSWFAVPFTLLVLHSLLHGHFLSAPYFYETVGYGILLLQRAWPLFLILTILGVAVLWWLARHPGRLRTPDGLRRPALAALAALLLGYALYGWFLRPELSAITMRPDVFSGGEIPVTNHENWPRLGWYLTPLGVWLGVLGGCLLLWRVNRRTVLLLALGWLFSLLYLWNISANPHHVYVMRRYVPAVAPFFVLAAAYLLAHRGFTKQTWNAPPQNLLSRIPHPAGAAIMAVIAVIWLGGLGWAARGFISQVDHAGLTDQVDHLNSLLPGNAVLLFDDQSPVGQGDIWGTPLKFIYGHEVFTLRADPETVSAMLVETIKTWQNSGRSVIWIGDTQWLDNQAFTYRSERVTLNRKHLESSYEYKPQVVVTDPVELTISYLESD